MSKRLVTILKVLLSVGLAAVILYFVFRKIDIEAFLDKAQCVDYSWVILSMCISLFGYILRAYRWRLQFESLGFQPTTYRMFLAVMSGYLANLLLPRLGEVTRCGVLYKSDKIPVSTSFGSVITERIVDVVALGLILLLTFAMQSKQLLAFIGETANLDFNWKVVLGILVIVGAAGAFIFFKWIYPSQTKIGEFSRGLISGLISLKDVDKVKFILSTIGIWVIYFFMSYLVVFSVKETTHLGWEVGLSILSAGVIAFVLPVQSGFGTFHALVSAMLLLYGIDETAGVFFATLLHGSQLLAVLIYGLVATVLSIFITRNEQQTENTNLGTSQDIGV